MKRTLLLCITIVLITTAILIACKKSSSGSTTTTTTTTDTTTASDCSGETGVAKVVCLANAFLATLSTAQQDSVVETLDLANAKLWSNLPCGLSCRDGIPFSSLTPLHPAGRR